ncbi:MAG: signal peptidase I [Thermoleophilaceae bacterium]
MSGASGALAVSAPALTGRVARRLRSTVSFAVWLVVGFALALTAVVVGPPAFGHRSLTVISGSMEPTLETGSVVVDEVIAPVEARPGDIVTFNDPVRRRQVTHRLRSMRVEGGVAHMVTKGDANDAAERWSVPVTGEIGRVAYQVPKLGYVRALMSTREVRLGLVGMVLLLGVLLLWDLWRPRGRAS